MKPAVFILAVLLDAMEEEPEKVAAPVTAQPQRSGASQTDVARRYRQKMEEQQVVSGERAVEAGAAGVPAEQPPAAPGAMPGQPVPARWQARTKWWPARTD
jgi:hypothetical protein